MQISKHWIEENFILFNTDYFGGVLPLPKFSVSKARTRLGSFKYKWKIIKSGFLHSSVKRKSYDFTIRISNYYDITEKQYQNILLHEMIHFYIAFKNLNDTSVHGKIFRAMMDSLNEKGWNVCVSTDVKKWPVTKSRENKKQIVLAFTMENKCLFGVVNPNYVRKLDNMASNTSFIKSHSWFVSTDVFFQDFSRSRTLCGRVVPNSLFDKYIKEMQPLVLK